MLNKTESLRDLRVRLRISQTAAAATVGIAPNTYRVGELCREAVSQENQTKINDYESSLRALVSSEAA